MKARYRPFWELTPTEFLAERMRRDEQKGKRVAVPLDDAAMDALGVGPQTKEELRRRANGKG